ncbi:hypothetical protein SDC9_89856 [bioreactor metagenome]|uniref:Uncharacterized protein n=1 Tax=bioreactor metagenome TaxID=1076179 RepID=A0A644ZX20_9ZZZZ
MIGADFHPFGASAGGRDLSDAVEPLKHGDDVVFNLVLDIGDVGRPGHRNDGDRHHIHVDGQNHWGGSFLRQIALYEIELFPDVEHRKVHVGAVSELAHDDGRTIAALRGDFADAGNRAHGRLYGAGNQGFDLAGTGAGIICHDDGIGQFKAWQ